MDAHDGATRQDAERRVINVVREDIEIAGMREEDVEGMGHCGSS